MSFSTSSSRVQLPSALAASIMPIPAGAIRSSRSSFAIRFLLGPDQALPRRRGENHSMVRSSSSADPVLSIQPKRSASITAPS